MVDSSPERNRQVFLACGPVRANSVLMSAQQVDWHQDLVESRDLTDWEKQHFGFVLSWFEGWRLRKRLEPGQDAGNRRLEEDHRDFNPILTAGQGWPTAG